MAPLGDPNVPNLGVNTETSKEKNKREKKARAKDQLEKRSLPVLLPIETLAMKFVADKEDLKALLAVASPPFKVLGRHTADEIIPILDRPIIAIPKRGKISSSAEAVLVKKERYILMNLLIRYRSIKKEAFFDYNCPKFFTPKQMIKELLTMMIANPLTENDRGVECYI